MARRTPDPGFFSDPHAQGLLSTLDDQTVPAHVAIIMDGNGRWATQNGLPRVAGHKAGAEAVREAILTALELGVRCLTVYSFSSENWSRPPEEVSRLMSLFTEVVQREIDNLDEKDVRVRVIGDKDGLPKATRRAFDDAELRTAENRTLDFVVAMNYGGRAEISRACTDIARAAADGRLDPSSVDEETIEAHLYTAGIPDPDLLIRTSGEMRVSNFLLWQIAYSELWITETLWPDFDRNTFLSAICDYQRRQRRFGG